VQLRRGTEWYGLRVFGAAEEEPDEQWQFDAGSVGWLQPLVAETEVAVRAALDSTIPQLRGLGLVATKLVHSAPGARRQHVHMDIVEESALHTQCIAVLLHLEPTVTAFVQRDLNASADQLCAAQAGVGADERCFVSRPATAGTILAFRTDVYHYGPANRSTRARRVIYLLFAPRHTRSLGSYQTFCCAPDLKV
jgi:hypothetical protein